MTYFKLLQSLKNHWYSSLRGHQAKINFYNVWKCLEILPYFQNGFPTTIWVKAYLGGTIKKHPPQNHLWFYIIGSQEPSPLIFRALDIYSQNQCKMFFVFTSFHGPCFSTSNLIWNCCRFCKLHFLSPVHLTCNKFNVHRVAHKKIFHPCHHFTQKTTIVN